VRNEEFPLLVPEFGTNPVIIQPGHSVWRTAKAGRLDVLVGGQATSGMKK
jgi:hypothetical protein